MHTTEEQQVAQKKDDDAEEVTADEASSQNRYEVTTLTLRARKKIRDGVDVSLEELGDELDEALNDMVQRGGKLQFIQLIEGNGFLVQYHHKFYAFNRADYYIQNLNGKKILLQWKIN